MRLKRIFKPKICLVCNIAFARHERHSDKQWKLKIFCSSKCFGENKSNLTSIECDYCGLIYKTKPSHLLRKEKHFCSQDCHSKFRAERLPFHKQPSYKGIRKPEDGESVYTRNARKKRYILRKNIEGSHSLEEWENLKQKYNHKCAKCNESKPLTKDHIIPMSKGGSDYIINIQPLCKICNCRKGNKIIENPELWEKVK